MVIEYLSKTDLVADALRDQIRSGEISAGALLRQRDLAVRFNVSPTPVREALRRLEAEGFVVTELHKGASVVRAGESRAEENLLVRAALEPLGAKLAAQHRSEENLEAIEAAHQELRRCSAADPRIFQLNRTFHLCIYASANSPVLTSMLNLLWHSLDERQMVKRPLAQSIAQHGHILEAIRDGDAELAAKLTLEHITGS